MMASLRDFVADMLETEGAAVEPLEPDGLAVLAPDSVRSAMGWPELTRLGFGAELPDQALRIGLESDWLDRIGGLLGERGRWAERQAHLPLIPPSDPVKLLDRALDLPNAVWRFHAMTQTWARCLILTFRYSALSDEKREGLVWLGFNLSTGAALGEVLPRLRTALGQDDAWQAPDPTVRQAAGPAWPTSLLADRVQPALDQQIRQELDPFLNAMRRRLDRDSDRIHAYHDDLRAIALKRLAALTGSAGDKAESDRRRETLRIAAIEREYQAKLEDLRHNYALTLSVDWVQALELYVPVQRLEFLVRRRKGERLVALDWHPLVRLAELPPCDWGLDTDRRRLVCDEKLHLTEPAGQAACDRCAKVYCRACHAEGCPHCARTAR